MKFNVSRYDVLVSDRYDIQDLDFILAKDDRKIIHGTVWDENDEPCRVPGAVIRLYLPGPKYYTEDPCDLIPIGYTISDENGEFFAGPFKQGTSVIIKIFKMDTCNYSGEKPCKPVYDNGGNDEYASYTGRTDICHATFSNKKETPPVDEYKACRDSE